MTLTQPVCSWGGLIAHSLLCSTQGAGVWAMDGSPRRGSLPGSGELVDTQGPRFITLVPVATELSVS